jgi:hypothetical protein
LIWPKICFQHPEAHVFIKKITDTTIAHQRKVKAGVNAVQILTLGRNVVSSGLSRILMKYINQIIEGWQM